MWQNFQKALEIRVRDKNKPRKKTDRKRTDKFTIIKAAEKVIGEKFGQEGLKNTLVFLKESDGRTIYLKNRHSVWKMELKLHQEDIVKKINEKIGEDLINYCVIK